MANTLIDTHAHLDYPDFDKDRPQVIERAWAVGIRTIISVGTNLDSSRRAIQLSEQYPQVYAAIGWHPSEAEQAPENLAAALRPLAGHPKVVALGETGLDFYRLPSQQAGFTAADDERYKTKQRVIFRQQLQLAAEFGLNCIIHQRESLEEVMREMKAFEGRLRGVFHCFVNDAVTAARIFSLRSLVSFTGILTFKNAQNVRDALAAIPLNQFMLETDCPFLAPVPYRGKRCEPGYVKDIAEAAARVKGCGLEELSAATSATAQEFFPKLREL